MKKIDLITGFLGAGKTTFLKQYVKYLVSKGEKVCILENDFGAVNVDMMLLSDLRSDSVELEMVSGGCDSDCHKRRFKTKLIAMGMDDYTRIIVEPSGIFDLDEFFDCLYDEPLCNWYKIGSVIGIVDSLTDKNLSTEARYILATEMAYAGMIVLSKTQDARGSEVEDTKKLIYQALEEVSCKAEIPCEFLEKNWNELTDDDFKEISNAGYKRASFVKKPEVLDSFNSIYFLDKKLSPDKVKSISDKLFNDKSYGNVIRLKGFSQCKNHWMEINADKLNFSIKEREEGQDVIIIIGEHLKEDKIREEVLGND